MILWAIAVVAAVAVTVLIVWLVLVRPQRQVSGTSSVPAASAQFTQSTKLAKPVATKGPEQAWSKIAADGYTLAMVPSFTKHAYTESEGESTLVLLPKTGSETVFAPHLIIARIQSSRLSAEALTNKLIKFGFRDEGPATIASLASKKISFSFDKDAIPQANPFHKAITQVIYAFERNGFTYQIDLAYYTNTPKVQVDEYDAMVQSLRFD